MGGRPFVDWRRVGPAVQAMILNELGQQCPACGGWGLQYPDPDSGACTVCNGTGEVQAKPRRQNEQNCGEFPCLGTADDD